MKKAAFSAVTVKFAFTFCFPSATKKITPEGLHRYSDAFHSFSPFIHAIISATLTFPFLLDTYFYEIHTNSKKVGNMFGGDAMCTFFPNIFLHSLNLQN